MSLKYLRFLGHESAAAVLVRHEPCTRERESGPLRAVHLSRHKWPGGSVNKERASAVLSESIFIQLMMSDRQLKESSL